MAENCDKNDLDRKEIPTCDATPKDWMSYLREDLTIKDVTLFGTHSSCAGNTDKMKLLDELKNGARFLDLHLANYNNEVYIYHDSKCFTLKVAFEMIMKFITCNETEKVIVYLQNSSTENMKVEWSEIQALFPVEMKKILISKSKSEEKLKDMKGNIILMAPSALDIDANWGTDFIKSYLAPEDTDTLVGLHAFLFEIAVCELDEKKDKPVWVEARSRRKENDKRKEDELTEVAQVFIKDTEFYNIVTFSQLDNEDYFDSLKKNGMFKFEPT